KTLQPRVGFSEDLFGTGKTILRGGIGSFYERLQGNDIYDVAPSVPFSNTPSASNVYLTNPGTSYVTGASAALPFGPQGLTTLARTFPAPGIAQFSLGVQHEIKPSVVAVVQYVGNLAWHQNIRRQINNYHSTRRWTSVLITEIQIITPEQTPITSRWLTRISIALIGALTPSTSRRTPPTATTTDSR